MVETLPHLLPLIPAKGDILQPPTRLFILDHLETLGSRTCLRAPPSSRGGTRPAGLNPLLCKILVTTSRGTGPYHARSLHRLGPSHATRGKIEQSTGGSHLGATKPAGSSSEIGSSHAGAIGSVWVALISEHLNIWRPIKPKSVALTRELQGPYGYLSVREVSHLQDIGPK